MGVAKLRENTFIGLDGTVQTQRIVGIYIEVAAAFLRDADDDAAIGILGREALATGRRFLDDHDNPY